MRARYLRKDIPRNCFNYVDAQLSRGISDAKTYESSVKALM